MAREKGTGSLQLEKSGRWTVRFNYGGKSFSRSARTRDRETAERFLQRILSPLGLGKQRLALADVWHLYEISPNHRELAPSTLHAKQLVWIHFARWLEKWHPEITQLAHISAETIGSYLIELRTNHTASTYNGRVCVLREIFRTLSDKAGFVDDPWSNVKLLNNDSRSRRELTLDELKRLVSAAERKAGEWKLLFLTGIYTGLRLGDCCLLENDSVQLERNVIQLIPRKTRKHSHGMPITIPIHQTLRLALETRHNQGADVRFVMPSMAEAYLQHKWRVSEGIAAVFKTAGIRMSVMIDGRHRATPEATFHSLRHTFVSLSANAGVPLPVIASIVGHTSTAMTRHYYHENETALRSAVEAIPML